VRIENIEIKNYRQFRNVSLVFNKVLDNDLHVMIADNATGKTNLLNAINWCLYGNEPHLSKDSQQLPRLNLNTLVQADEGKQETVSVELITETEGNRITFRRAEEYIIHKNSLQPIIRDIKFTVTYVDDKKNAKWVSDEEGVAFVERFVPLDIREFFFFDGERLDTYFRSATGQQISNAIFRISQVDALNRISDRLESIIGDIKREAGKRSPQIEEKRAKIETKETNCKDISEQISELNKQNEDAKIKITGLNEQLRNIPDIEKLQKEQAQLKETGSKKEQILSEKKTDKQNILFEYGVILKIFPCLEKSLLIIQHKIDNREIPQTHDIRLLDNILSTNLCICGSKVEKESTEASYIKRLRAEIEFSSKITQELQQMILPIEHMKSKISMFTSILGKITNEIQIYEEELSQIAIKSQAIDAHIGGYDVEKVKQWYSELKNYQESYDFNVKRIANLELERGSLEKEINILDQELKQALKKESVFQELSRQIDFTNKASVLITNVIETMMSDVRIEIEKETKKNFFTLIWKKETYKDVSIDDNYSLHLLHSLGFECLGSISASERQLLALSFVIALHKVSGFDSPILVDTPVARVSNEQRENLGNIFHQVSNNKQLILLFLPTEYSIEISKTIDSKASSIRKLSLIESERELQMEVLR